MHDIKTVIENIQELYQNNSALAILKDFERVLDELDLYAYKNWQDGELAYGPKTERYWITAGFMWPRDQMPDPVGAKRLADIGCKIKYKKSHLIEPRPIRTIEDMRPGTKKGQLDHKPIWVVEITMPRKIAFEMYKGYMDKMRNDSERVSEILKTTQPPSGMAAPQPPMAQAPAAPPTNMNAGMTPPIGGI